MRNILIYLILVTTFLISIPNTLGKRPWNIVLMDVSSDMDAYAKNGINEMRIADGCLKHLITDELADTVMFFAEGRTIVPMKNLSNKKLDYTEIRRIVGDGTSINDALASCLGLKYNANRIVVISNGREVGSSISSSTLSKLMNADGVRVDAIVVSSGCDSIYLKSEYNSMDSTLYERTHVHSGLKCVVDQTGGKFTTVGRESDIDDKIDELLCVVTKQKTVPSKVGCNLNPDLTKKMVARIKPQKLYICEVDTNVIIKYRGIKYHGLNDILNNTDPCSSILIDRDNINLEDFCPLNIVFASNPNEKDRKRLILNQVMSDSSYCKLSQVMPIDILPMIYYSGNGSKMQLCGLEFESANN